MTTLTPSNLRQHLDRIDPDHADRVFDAVRQVTTMHRVHLCGPLQSPGLRTGRVVVIALLRCRGEQGGPGWAEIARLLGNRTRQAVMSLYGDRKNDVYVRRLVTECQEILAAQSAGPAVRPTPHHVKAAVSEAFGVSVHDLIAPGRLDRLQGQARDAAALLIRDLCRYSYPQTAKALRRRTHTGVLGMVKRAQADVACGTDVCVGIHDHSFAELVAKASDMALASANPKNREAGAA